jgi:hypothetical protein
VARCSSSDGYRQTALAPFHRLTTGNCCSNGDAAATRLGASTSPTAARRSCSTAPTSSCSLFLGHSPGVEDCRGEIRGQRLDTRSERRFLARYVP